jgi:O-antigen ligase
MDPRASLSHAALARRAAAPARAPNATLALVGRALLVAIAPLSLVWIPMAGVPGLGNVAVVDAVLIALWAATAADLLMRGAGELELGPPILVVLATAIAALAGIGAELSRTGRGVVEFLLFMKRFGLAAILPLAAARFRSPAVAAWTRAVVALTAAALAVSTFSPAVRDLVPRPAEWDPTAMGDRATGLLTNPNDLAYAAIALALLHAALLPRRGWLARLGFALTLASSAVCVAAAGSRSATMGALAAVAFLLLSSAVRLQAKIVIVLVGVALAFGLSASEVFTARLGQFFDRGVEEENVSSRLEAQMVAARASFERPFGVGFGAFPGAISRSMTAYAFTTTDSVYFDTLLGAGFLGLAALLALFVVAWRRAGRARGAAHARVLQAGLVAFFWFGTATVVPVSMFLAPLFFSFVAGADPVRAGR